MLDRARYLIESTSTRVPGYHKSPYFDFYQESSSSFQISHLPSLEEEGVILDWKQVLCISMPKHQVSSLELKTITYKTFLDPLLAVLDKEESEYIPITSKVQRSVPP